MVRHNIDTIVKALIGESKPTLLFYNGILTKLQTLETKAIEVTDLTVAYQDKPVLWDIDLDVPPGVLLAIVGPNGAGKTTLIKAILGLVRPAAGNVLIYDKPYQMQRRIVGYVPQRGTVDWDFPTSVLDVVMMGRYGALGGYGDRESRIANLLCLHWRRLAWRRIGLGKSANSLAVNSNVFFSRAPSFKMLRCT